MAKGVLIVGGSLAGIQAALDLANSGIKVHLVETSPFLGNGGAETMPRHLLNTRLLEIAKHPISRYGPTPGSVALTGRRAAFAWRCASIPATSI